MQFDDLRGRLTNWNPRAQWVQLGLLSASIMAPLVGRWNELRTAERARALREETETRLAGLRVSLPWHRPGADEALVDLLKQPGGSAEKGRSPVSTRLWLIGVGVGLIAAGAGAYVLVRRRIEHSADEASVSLPLPATSFSKSLGNGHNGTASWRPSPLDSSADDAVPLASTETARPAGVGTATRGGWPASTANARAAAQQSAMIAPSAGAPEQSVPTTDDPEQEASSVDVDYIERAPFIGNIRTMIYHEADADNLPAEDNRIYFTSEDEARASGYRRDREGVTTPESES